jgi:hypothetical protein
MGSGSPETCLFVATEKKKQMMFDGGMTAELREKLNASQSMLALSKWRVG